MSVFSSLMICRGPAALLAAVLAGIGSLSFSTAASAQAPTLSHAVPAAVQPGQTVDVTLFGGNLANATTLWTSFTATAALPTEIAENGKQADHVLYRVTVPADVPVGVYGIRLATMGGVSNVRLLMVDDLPSVADNGANKTLPTAQVVTLPLAIDGTCEAESFDFYKFTAAAGQRVSIEVMARRLGSALDPVIRLLDAQGHEIAYSDDEPGIGPDGRLAHRFETAGDYYVEIRDIRYEGSANHRYRLRMGDFPLATVPYPLAAAVGTTPSVVVAGPSVENVAPVSITVSATTAGARVPVNVKSPGGQGSTSVSLVSSSGAETLEIEPNDTPEASTPIPLTGAINGRLQAKRDRDYFHFEAKAGQRFLLTGQTRSLGSPSDLYLRLLKPDGSTMIDAEDTGTDEGVVDFNCPADGVYRLMVEDINRGGGEDHVYRIQIDPYAAGFALNVENDKLDAPKAGVFVTKVTSVRRDYNGPITLSIQGIDGMALANNVIPEGQNEATLNVTLPATLEPGQQFALRIVGTAKIGEQDVTAVAKNLVPLRAALSGLSNPPSDLVGLVALGVGPLFPDYFQLTAPTPVVPFPQVVGTTTFKVATTRTNGFDDKVTLAVAGLPEGFTATVPAIEKGQTEAAIQITGPATAAEADIAVTVSGSAVFQNQPKSVQLGGLTLKVVKPLAATLVPAGPLVPGGKQIVKVQITRHGDPVPVNVQFKNLPAGVTVAENLVIPADKAELDVELTAAADAVVGKVDLVVAVSTKIKEQDIVADSTPASLEVNQQ